MDPLIISFSGSIELCAAAIDAIRAGLEPEDAFARFAGTCHALAPDLFEAKLFEAHEGFWCFDPDAPTNRMSGELAWFQMGVYTSTPRTMPIPLLLHAGATAVEQLGKCSIDTVRLQVPLDAHALSDEAIQPLLDQFAATEHLRQPVTVRVRLISRTRSPGWTTASGAWLEDAYLEPFAVRDLTVSNTQVDLDARWFLRQSKSACDAAFSSPEWSPAAAATITLLMLQAARAAGAHGSVIVELTRS